VVAPAGAKPRAGLRCRQQSADQRGTYTFLAVGQSQACVINPDKGTTNSVSVAIVLTVAQDPHDLSTGTVTFTGTGHPLIDGVPLEAKFSRQRFEADQQSSNLPNACPRESASWSTRLRDRAARFPERQRVWVGQLRRVQRVHEPDPDPHKLVRRREDRIRP